MVLVQTVLVVLAVLTLHLLDKVDLVDNLEVNNPLLDGGTRGNGGLYGGAGGGTYYGNNQGGRGANGAVRVIWGDDNVSRQFPNTNTSQGSSVTVQQV